MTLPEGVTATRREVRQRQRRGGGDCGSNKCSGGGKEIPARSVMEELPPDTPSKALTVSSMRASGKSTHDERALPPVVIRVSETNERIGSARSSSSSVCSPSSRSRDKEGRSRRRSSERKKISTTSFITTEDSVNFAPRDEGKSCEGLLTDSANDSKISPATNSGAASTAARLDKINASQNILREELEQYMQEMKSKIDLGTDFEANVAEQESSWKKFTLDSTAAAEEMKQDSELQAKIARGKRKIDRLDAKLRELEDLEESQSEARVEGTEREEDAYIEDTMKPRLLLPDLTAKPEPTSTLSGTCKSARSGMKRGLSVKQRETGAFVTRNIELVETGCRSALTLADEARLSALLTDLDQEYSSVTKDCSTPQETRQGQVVQGSQDLLALSLSPHGASANQTLEARIYDDEGDGGEIGASLRRIVGEEEWETKSLYLRDDCDYVDRSDCEGNSSMGPLLTARSTSNMSFLSNQSYRSTILRDLQAERQDKARLKQIDSALDRMKALDGTILDRPGNQGASDGKSPESMSTAAVGIEMNVMLDEARTYIENSLGGCLADRSEITKLLQTVTNDERI